MAEGDTRDDPDRTRATGADAPLPNARRLDAPPPNAPLPNARLPNAPLPNARLPNAPPPTAPLPNERRLDAPPPNASPPDLGATVDPGDAGRSFNRVPLPLGETVPPRVPLGETRPGHAATDLAATRPSLAHSRPGEPADGLVVPERLGRYVVLSQLGAGGMGVVYKAYDPELDRKVALKLLLGSASPQAAARLKREAQAMARLSHPNVVPIHDVGQVGGQIFVAMDFVDGETLSAWMATRRPWQEVADMFAQAGHGLAAAHAVGLIHRDFKPDNVLLSRDPATGALRARVADFGLARRDDDVAEPLRPDSELVHVGRNSMLDHGMTRIGAVIGTPMYMSPEQHLGATVDARTDQFSFCVAFFEALYGARPFTGDTVEALGLAASQPRRAPPPPGSRVPGWLHRLCIRGMQPDRDARIPDMDALLAELARRRVQGRTRWLLGGAAAVAVAASLYAASRPAPVERCGGGPARMVGVWDDELQAAAARAFTDSGAVFAADAWTAARAQIDRYTGEWLAMHRESCEATARGEQSSERMDLRMRCLDRRLQDLAALTRLYRAADRQVVRRAFDAALSLPPIETCADPDAAPPPPPEQADAVDAARAALAEARSLGAAGKSKEALARAREAADLAAPLTYPPLRAEARLVLGRAMMAGGEDEAAVPGLADAVGGALEVGDDAHLLDAVLNLADVTGWKLGRDKEAATWLAVARGVVARAGDRPQDEARVLTTQASVDIAAGRYAEAATRLERSLGLQEALHGPTSPRLANTVNALGSAYLRSGRYAEAEALLVRATAMAEAAGGPSHPDVALPLNNLALSHERQGRHADAIVTLRRARAIFAENSGPDHPNVGILQQNIAGMLRLGGDLPAARAEIDGALAILEAKLGAQHPAFAGALSVSGEIAIEAGDLARARADFQRADELRRTALGEDHPDRALTLLGLGKVALAEGQAAAALPPLERGLQLILTTTPDPTDLAELRFALARALWVTGDRTRADALAGEARTGLVSAGVVGQRTLAELDRWLAERT